MNHTVNQLGFSGKDLNSLPEDDKVGVPID
jgi:hypothetical protein